MGFRNKAMVAAMVVGISAIALPSAVVAQAAPAPAGPKIKLSEKASKAVIALQSAVVANDTANFPALLAAAQTAARTNDDRYAIGQLWLRASVTAKDNAGIVSAIDQMIASGLTPADLAASLRFSQARIKYQAKDYAGSAALLQQLLAANPGNSEALLLLAESHESQGQGPMAVATIQKAMAARTASGQPIPQDWMRRAVSLAYKYKLPVVTTLATDWIRAYPDPTNIRDAVRIYAETSGLADSDQIDLFRLQRAANALKGESEYYRYANIALSKGLPGEAKAVLDEGFASRAIDRSRPVFKEVYTVSSGKVAADKASLASSQSAALAGSAAKPAVATGDAYLGYGDYAKAAALYRASLGKTGADPSLSNLRLGTALALSGDKAGATAAFNTVTGARRQTASLWLAWLSGRK